MKRGRARPKDAQPEAPDRAPVWRELRHSSDPLDLMLHSRRAISDGLLALRRVPIVEPTVIATTPSPRRARRGSLTVAVAESALTPEVAGERAEPTRPLLSVVVPVYNQAGRSSTTSGRSVSGSRRARRADRADRRLGRLDRRERGALARGRPGSPASSTTTGTSARAIAVKTGALAARGRWISYVDADLDLDPGLDPRLPASSRSEE